MNNYIRLLNNARLDIEQRKQEFICLAIMKHARSNDLYEAAKTLVLHIEHAIRPYKTLENWLKGNRIASATLVNNKNMIHYRLRYIDHLIEQFKDKQ